MDYTPGVEIADRIGGKTIIVKIKKKFLIEYSQSAKKIENMLERLIIGQMLRIERRTKRGTELTTKKTKR